MTKNKNPNAPKRGASSKIVFLPGENPQEYEKLKADLFMQYQPSGRWQERIMITVAKGLWLMRRWNRRSGQSKNPRQLARLQGQ
jgi:hypothetical protein